jgi:dolichol kinase
MANEIRRQMVHLSGLAFIMLAQSTGRILAGLCFFMIALGFLVYSEYIKKEQKRFLQLAERYKQKFRDFLLGFEREEAARPFQGAFWFFFSMGLAFLLFPLGIASQAGAILAVGDSLSTIVGKTFGRHKILGSKTLEGTSAFFFSALAVSLFFMPLALSAVVSLFATLIELIPASPGLKGLNKKGWLDDNLLIPLATGAFLVLLY